MLGETDIAPLVDVLVHISPVQLLKPPCPRATQLCVVHRLSEDMSLRDPVEGWSKRMDWLKGLIMALAGMGKTDIFSSIMMGGGTQNNSGSETLEAHMKPAFQQVHQFLHTAVERMVEDIRSGRPGPLLPSKNGDGNDALSQMSIEDRLMAFSASNVVAEIQMLTTVIAAKYMH